MCSRLRPNLSIQLIEKKESIWKYPMDIRVLNKFKTEFYMHGDASNILETMKMKIILNTVLHAIKEIHK